MFMTGFCKPNRAGNTLLSCQLTQHATAPLLLAGRYHLARSQFGS